MRDTDLLNARLTKLQQDYQNQIDAADNLANDNQNKAAELKVNCIILSAIIYYSKFWLYENEFHMHNKFCIRITAALEQGSHC